MKQFVVTVSKNQQNKIELKVWEVPKEIVEVEDVNKFMVDNKVPQPAILVKGEDDETTETLMAKFNKKIAGDNAGAPPAFVKKVEPVGEVNIDEDINPYKESTGDINEILKEGK